MEYAILTFILGWYVGRSVQRYQFIRKIQKLQAGWGADEIKTVVIPTLHTEIIGDILYLYDKEGTFMCQGKDITEVAAKLKNEQKLEVAFIFHENLTQLYANGEMVS